LAVAELSVAHGDFGYDISNYLDVHPISGNLDDFGTLVAVAHASNLKVILNLVPNHTSDQHPWFIESRSSHDNCHFPFRLMKIASLPRSRMGWMQRNQPAKNTASRGDVDGNDCVGIFHWNSPRRVRLMVAPGHRVRMA
jgi:glycosidase